jgi:penicillin-binding protein 2
MEGVKLRVRTILVAILVAIGLIVSCIRLLSLQAKEVVQTPNTNTATSKSQVVVPTIRGEILDRYGRTLVSHQISMDLTLEYDAIMNSPSSARHVLSLIEGARQLGTQYADSLPVSYAPYEFTEMTQAQMEQLERFFEKSELEPGTAVALMQALSQRFQIPGDFSKEEERLVCGVLYELELRYLYTRVAPYAYIPPYVFAQNVSMALVSIVNERGIPGAKVEMNSSRSYETTAAAHILGRVGAIPAEEIDSWIDLGYSRDELIGIDGAERAFESYLRATPGIDLVETNASSQVVSLEHTVDPQPGGNVLLTIDIQLQERAERILAEEIQNLQKNGVELKGKEAEAGSVVILDVDTGEILAMANYPTYRLDSFQAQYSELLEDPLKPLVNRAIAGIYSPGSTFKMVTATGGLEEGIISAGTTILDHGRYTYFPDFQPKCSGYHGAVNVTGALRVSCNYFFFDVGRRLSVAGIGYWAQQYGLGLPTGIELKGESVGFVAGPQTSVAWGTTWFPGNTLSAAIGQSDHLYTPLQLCNYVATIANGGTVNQAHLLKEVKNSQYTQTLMIHSPGVLNEMDLSPGTLKAIKEGMYGVANTPGGTAYSVFAGSPLTVGAKTGSVQINDKPNNGVFVAFAPFDKPEIAVCVVVEKGGAGSRIAPIARRVLEEYFELQASRLLTSEENNLQK